MMKDKLKKIIRTSCIVIAVAAFIMIYITIDNTTWDIDTYWAVEATLTAILAGSSLVAGVIDSRK